MTVFGISRYYKYGMFAINLQPGKRHEIQYLHICTRIANCKKTAISAMLFFRIRQPYIRIFAAERNRFFLFWREGKGVQA